MFQFTLQLLFGHTVHKVLTFLKFLFICIIIFTFYADQTQTAISQVFYYAILSSYKNSVATKKDGFLKQAARELHSSLFSLLSLKE